MPFIYHIAIASDWRQAVADGAYTTSSLGQSLADVGFIHASTASQLNGVANRFYRGKTGLLLLVIDTGKLTAPLRYDDVPGSDQPFPHVYGPLNLGAVVRAVPLAADPDATFRIDLPG